MVLALLLKLLLLLLPHRPYLVQRPLDEVIDLVVLILALSCFMVLALLPKLLLLLPRRPYLVQRPLDEVIKLRKPGHAWSFHSPIALPPR